MAKRRRILPTATIEPQTISSEELRATVRLYEELRGFVIERERHGLETSLSGTFPRRRRKRASHRADSSNQTVRGLVGPAVRWPGRCYLALSLSPLKTYSSTNPPKSPRARPRSTVRRKRRIKQ